MILSREMMAGSSRLGGDDHLVQHAVDAEPDAERPSRRAPSAGRRRPCGWRRRAPCSPASRPAPRRPTPSARRRRPVLGLLVLDRPRRCRRRRRSRTACRSSTRRLVACSPGRSPPGWPAWGATTGRIWRFVMNAMSSSANTLVGSAMASVRVPPIRLTGSTSYFLAMWGGTSRSVSASTSRLARVMEGMPYWRDRKPISCSSVMEPWRTSTEPSLSALPFCSPRAWRSWASVMRPSATRRSPSRRTICCPSFT